MITHRIGIKVPRRQLTDVEYWAWKGPEVW